MARLEIFYLLVLLPLTITDTEHYAPTESCPKPQNNPPGLEGSPCKAHTACFPFMNLVCTKPVDVKEQGKCKKLMCKSEQDCTSLTSLPIRCSRGFCKVKTCSKHQNCPTGYACDSAGQCKEDLGFCEYNCDCSSCNKVNCVRGRCICEADDDECTVASVQDEDALLLLNLLDEDTKYSNGTGRKNFSDMKNCPSCSCPPGWNKTDSGCYKLFSDKVKDKVAKNIAQEKCANEGGFIAEVTTRKEMMNLHLVFRGKVIPVWLGAQRVKGEKFKWNSGVHFMEDQVGEEGNDGGCLIREAQQKKVVSCDEKFYVLCEVAKIQPAI